MKNVLIGITVLFLLLQGIARGEESECDKVLDLGFNIYKLYSEAQINESYYAMLGKSEQELDSLANQYESGDALDGAYKMIAISWSKNRKNKSFRERFRTAKFRYEAGLTIDNSFFDFIKTKTVNDETLSKWESCKKLEIEKLIAIKELELKKGGFVQEIVGDESGVFTFIINKIPSSGHPVKARIANVTKSNIEFLGSYNFKPGEEIENYTGIAQSMRLIDPYKKASIVVNIEGYNPISQEFTKNALSNFPLGSIIASVLDFNEFSFETNNNPDRQFNPLSSKWAPADGRSVSGSDYSKYNSYAPDLRGQFLRGANIIYSTNEPASFLNGKDEGVREVKEKYSYQKESTKLPANKFTGTTNTTGNHSHSFQAILNMGSRDGLRIDNDTTQANTGDRGTSTNGNHSHTLVVSGGGDKETRPKNMAVYYYIRINK